MPLLIYRQDGILRSDISRVHTGLLLQVFRASAWPHAISPQALAGLTGSPSCNSAIFKSLVALRVLRIVHKIASVSPLASNELGLISFLNLVAHEYSIELHRIAAAFHVWRLHRRCRMRICLAAFPTRSPFINVELVGGRLFLVTTLNISRNRHSGIPKVNNIR